MTIFREEATSAKAGFHVGPLSWSKKNIQWRVELPDEGQSCPVNWGNKIFITSAAKASTLARKCEISEVALLTEAFGAAFLYLGNQAHAVALKLERKPVPPRFRKPISGFGLYNRRNNVAFINPTPFRCSGIIETIPFEQIGRAVGFSISIYFYGRIILSAYRYGQQLIAKSKNKKFLKATKLFMSLTCIRIQSTKRRRLYHFVVS